MPLLTQPSPFIQANCNRQLGMHWLLYPQQLESQKKSTYFKDFKLQRETEHILALDKCTGAHLESVESFRKSRDFAQRKCP